ncbi:glycosidase [Sphaerochaeta pleomorpha str. Grapes]|uniref:Glycosidase n=1 Tax=Sphaerochaeta pleomorpha (strain ATCC BAA-1885 / DSM 22778 / Grapes) TaxID=158190 RepID=G8QV00_SPHPG|nr:alpha-amylase family glycosyl hydrolase [Sphaerochaeta pleomorpha]AEV28176.1 glycosidase [Sphaerochaeta pleomorpha str. Grapes]
MKSTLSSRLHEKRSEIENLWEKMYPNCSPEAFFTMLRKRYSQRNNDLKQLDAERLETPLWYMDSTILGQMLYTDKFNATFRGLVEKIPYLVSCGVRYLHLMPCSRMPEEHNDGGYAVEDFKSFDPKIGTTEDFIHLTTECRKAGISVCLDFVLNHTADTHAWALAARQGSKEDQKRYFFVFDKAEVDAYEATTEEVFPQQAPGNFTYLPDCNCYVMTTFNNFQWDLNYGNAEVLLSMLDNVLYLANLGVEVFRLDAIPYIWKQWGSPNRNLPQVHWIIRLFRLALEIVAPCCIIKGEVVMSPKKVAAYFGTTAAPECHLLYNVSLMVQMWNSLATRDTRLLQKCLTELPTDIPPSSCWVNYLRCHDDIGWGIEYGDLRDLGFSPFEHTQFLISFYHGTFEGSFSLGELYEFNQKTLDARNCGTSASLCGLERADKTHDKYQKELAIKRLLLAHSFIYFCKGITVLYSGDEIAQLNDYSYKMVPALQNDSRNVHRPYFDWEKTHFSKPQDSDAALVWTTLQTLSAYRAQEKDFSSFTEEKVISTNEISVIAVKRGEKHLVIANFSEYQKEIILDYPAFGSYTEVFSQRDVQLNGSPFIVGPYQYLLLRRN